MTPSTVRTPAVPRILYVAVLALLSATGAHAQTQTEQDQSNTTPVTQLGIIRATSDATSTEPTIGFQSTVSRAASRADMEWNETPHSVSSLTRDRIDGIGATTGTDALRYTPGAFTGLVGAATRYDYISLRGFNENSTDNLNLDGQKVLSDSGAYSSVQIDPFSLERIDVYRGPTSVLYGRNSPGGLVSYSSKRPLDEPYHEIIGGIGNNGQRILGFDTTGPIDKDGNAAYRIVGITRNSETQFVNNRVERYMIAPSLKFRLGENSRLLLQGYFQKDPSTGFHSGYPADATINTDHNGRRISPNFSDDDEGGKFSRTLSMLGYQFEHDFTPNLTFKNSFRMTSLKSKMAQFYGYGWYDENSLNRYYAGGYEELEAYQFDTSLTGVFHTGAASHEVIAGFDYQDRNTSGQWDAGMANPLDAFDPVYGNPGLNIYYNEPFDRKLEQFGLYLQDTVRYRGLTGLFSIRHDVVNLDNRNPLLGTKSGYKGNKTTYRAGLSYALGYGISPYASYSESFNPNGYTDVNGQVLPPTEARQYEVGVKYQPSEHVMLSAAYYDLKQENVAARESSATTWYVPLGVVRARGIELEANANVTDNLTVTASYTMNNMKLEKGDNAGNRPFQAPKQMASVWGRYGFNNGLALSAGVRYVGKSWADNENTVEVPAYTLVDVGAEYDMGRLNSNLKGSSVRLNVNNLTNKTYVASCATTNYCYYGEKRNIMATFSYKW